MSVREEGVSSSIPLSSVAQGKQKEASLIIPTVTIFLPRGLRQSLRRSPQANFILGWYFKSGPSDDNLKIVVVGLVPTLAEDVKSQEAKANIIGVCKLEGARPKEEGDDIASKTSKVWLNLSFKTGIHTARRRKSSIVVLAGLRTPLDMKGDLTQCAIDVIIYTTPRSERMKFLSLEPMILPKASSAGILNQMRGTQDGAKDPHLQYKLEALIRLDPLRHQDFIFPHPKDRGPGQGFRKAVELLNQCSYLNERLTCPPTGKTNGHTESGGSLSWIILSWSAKFMASGCQGAKSMIHFSIGGVKISDISATARQLDLRLGQFIIWPSLGYQLRMQRRKDQEPVSNLAPRYIALYNGVWLVVNDVILGQAAGIWICDNHKSIARFLSKSLAPILVDGLISTLDWLDDWPAGLKLNTQLSHFFRDMFVGLTIAWNDTFLSPLSNDVAILGQLVYLVGLSCRLMGLTMLLSITIDLLQLLTLHWTIFYRIQQATFTFFCSSIISLFHLFRGKKRNPLRKNRIDQATYELDQLLLGTIFFTLLVFLWLTIAIYYLQFSLLRLGLVGIILILQTALAFLNHLPLFALMLRIKEPDRLPGGVELRHFKVDSAHNPLNCSYYELHNTPLGFQDIFRGYNDHLQAIQKLPHLLWSLVIGRKF